MNLRINKEIVEKEPGRIFFKILAFHKWGPINHLYAAERKKSRLRRR